MQRPVSGRAVGALLVAAHVLLASGIAVVFVNASSFRAGGEWLFAAMLATSISQAGLIGLWSGLANAPIRRRMWMTVSGGMLLCALLVVTLGIAWPRDINGAWIISAVFAMPPLVAIGVFAATLKWRGFRIERPGIGDKGPSRHVQFSLMHLFAITLIAALLLALVRGLRDLPFASNPFTILRVSLAGAFNALLFLLHTQACLWGALGMGRPVVRFGATLASTALAAGICGFASGGHSSNYQICAEMLTIYSVLVAGSLLVLRRLGYRLSRLAAPEVAGQEA